eukprot:UN05261
MVLNFLIGFGKAASCQNKDPVVISAEVEVMRKYIWSSYGANEQTIFSRHAWRGQSLYQFIYYYIGLDSIY